MLYMSDVKQFSGLIKYICVLERKIYTIRSYMCSFLMCLHVCTELRIMCTYIQYVCIHVYMETCRLLCLLWKDWKPLHWKNIDISYSSAR